MKVLFCGLGSIGTRHLRNLTALCGKNGTALEAYALRSSGRALPPETAALLAGEFAALPDSECWDIAFITGPTSLHAQQIENLRGRAGAFFIEKPLFAHTDYDLNAVGLGAGQKAYVAAPMRYCGAYRKMKELLVGLPVYSVRVICSSYLPDWRPGTDYTTAYSARRELGGGVALDLIHEWDYLIDLFGEPLECKSFAGTFSHLEIDAEDLAVYIARYPSFLCEAHLDYFGREYKRMIEIYSQIGCLVTDFYTGIVTGVDGCIYNCAEDGNERYLREMEYFLSYAAGGEPVSANSPEHALKTVKLALGES